MSFKLDYYNITHTGLSYSRQLVLHSCPKKYQLNAKYAIKANRSSVTFSYGHAVAAGVQHILAGYSFNRSMVETLLAYTHDANDEGDDGERNAKKSLWTALIGVEEFYKKYKAGQFGFLDGWEVAKFKNPTTGEWNPAIELTFVIKLLDGFTFEGHIDLILWHPIRKRFMVLEFKTTGSNNVNEASYKNSAQALGYGAVLDLMADQLGMSASFDVLYLVFQSRTRNLIPMPFTKTAKHRVDWLTSLVVDMQLIQTYEEFGYPKHGESCFDFFRTCEYMDTCDMSDAALATMYSGTSGKSEAESYTELVDPTFTFTLDELMERQQQLIDSIAAGNTNETGDAELFISSTFVD